VVFNIVECDYFVLGGSFMENGLSDESTQKLTPGWGLVKLLNMLRDAER
jgi:hypothetical protein